MKANRTLLSVVLSTALFTLLFYQKSLGLNLLLFELVLLVGLYVMREFDLKQRNVRFLLIATLFSGAMTLIHHTDLSITVNFLCFFLFIGSIVAPELKSILTIILTAFSSVFMIASRLKNKFSGVRLKQKKVGFNIRRSVYLFFPLLIIGGFSIFYSIANPKFGEIIGTALDAIEDAITHIVSIINMQLFGVIVLGTLISLFVFVRTKNGRIAEKDSSALDEYHRKRQKRGHFSPIGLINEYKASIFLFLTLNCMLFALNLLDINYVWLHFKWEGQYLKDFVHNGVYVLIFAILISILLVLFVFRGNLNFYKKGKWLKRLTYVWLIQNAFLVLSVGVRNWYYIDYYALADKRIAVFFFLILVLFALLTAFIKVRQTRSSFYFLRKNTAAVVVVLVVATFFHWDRIIADYNFKHAKRSFLHLNYLVGLSDAALPFLDQPLEQLIGANEFQKSSFLKVNISGSSSGWYDRLYLTPEMYLTQIEQRKKAFIRSWENKNWLEWNYGDYRAYRELKTNP